jgi:hypothetical protein
LTAFGDHLKNFAYSPEVPVIPPNRGDQTPDAGLWLEASFFPNAPLNVTLDFNAIDEQLGFFQVLVCYRKDIGQVRPSELADAVIDWFPKGLEVGPVRVRQTPYQLPAVTEDGSRCYIAVTIPYRGLVCADIEPPPEPPTTAPTLSLTVVSDSAIALEWTTVVDAEAYRVERSLNNSTWTAVAFTGGLVFGDTGLSGETEYFYRVVAYSEGGDGPFSNTESGTTLAAPLFLANFDADPLTLLTNYVPDADPSGLGIVGTPAFGPAGEWVINQGALGTAQVFTASTGLNRFQWALETPLLEEYEIAYEFRGLFNNNARSPGMLVCGENTAGTACYYIRWGSSQTFELIDIQSGGPQGTLDSAVVARTANHTYRARVVVSATEINVYLKDLTEDTPESLILTAADTQFRGEFFGWRSSQSSNDLGGTLSPVIYRIRAGQVS